MVVLLLTLSEAADRLRVSVRTLEREAADGRLYIVRVRKRRMVETREIDRYIAASTCQSAKKETVGKSVSASAVVAALSSAFRQGQPKKTRSTSKIRLSVATSTPLRVVRSEG